MPDDVQGLNTKEQVSDYSQEHSNVSGGCPSTSVIATPQSADVDSYTPQPGFVCLGIPWTARRSLSKAERHMLLRLLWRQIGVASAWILTIPLLCLAVPPQQGDSAYDLHGLFYLLAALAELFVLVLSFVVNADPIRRALSTFCDFQFGQIDRCEGKFDAAHCMPVDSDCKRSSKEESVWNTLRGELVSDPEKSHFHLRLSQSGRVIEVNGTRLQQWVVSNWSRPEYYSPARNFVEHQPVESTVMGNGDEGCFMVLMLILTNVLVYDIWSPPWYGIALTFISTCWILHLLVKWSEAKNR